MHLYIAPNLATNNWSYHIANVLKSQNYLGPFFVCYPYSLSHLSPVNLLSRFFHSSCDSYSHSLCFHKSILRSQSNPLIILLLCILLFLDAFHKHLSYLIFLKESHQTNQPINKRISLLLSLPCSKISLCFTYSHCISGSTIFSN